MYLDKIAAILREHNLDSKIGGVDYFTFHHDRLNFLIKKLESFYEPGKTFLEVGSLRGYLMIAAHLIGYTASGVDLSKFVEEAKSLCQKYSFTNLPLDLESDNLPFPDNSFDVIILSEVLEHLNFHPQNVFLEMARVLKKKGRVIITTPNLCRLNNIMKLIVNQSINAELDRPFTDGTHYREYSSGEITYLLQQAGLTNIQASFTNFKYPDLGTKVAISDIISTVLPKKKRDLCITADKE